MNSNRHIQLKVCGVRDHRNIEAIAALGPDYLGFNFYSASPRFVGEEFQVPKLPVSIKMVGVFVDAPLNKIIQTVVRYNLTHAQLHGNESPEHCAQLKSQGIRIIKAIGISRESSLDEAHPYLGFVDYFLFDTKSKAFGGTGQRFDWNLLYQYKYEVPFFLAGGIGPGNVPDLSRFAHKGLAAIDINSAVEIAPGIKDVSRIVAVQLGLKHLNKNELLIDRS